MRNARLHAVFRATFSLALGFVATLFAVVAVVKITPLVFALDPLSPIEVQRQLRVLHIVRSELRSDFEWDQQDNRVCIDGMPTSLFCELARASIRTIGHYQHDSAAMRSVRNVIDARYPDRWTVHPIMDFNNHSDTSRADLKEVIDESIATLDALLVDREAN
ncbi:MAG: hypothetical protein K0U72_15165 [Gammaproteobacteria bacterium]|nr:hypothetical protein [Gammaproteobacteria bacterium]